MDTFDRKKHWEKIYLTRELKELSWYQPNPATSLNFVNELNIPLTAKIIDIGGGDSYFVDKLLELGYTDITVLDISEAALNKAKNRLGERASRVKWIVSDAAAFNPAEKYDFWHDRAAFHFLTTEMEIENYISTIKQNINPDGVMVIGAFSEQGPHKCSGIAIKQYSDITLPQMLNGLFEKIKCITVDHTTPSGSVQNFIFCSFRKLFDSGV